MPGKLHGQRSLVGYSAWGHKRVRYDLVTKRQQSFKRKPRSKERKRFTSSQERDTLGADKMAFFLWGGALRKIAQGL